MNKLYLILTLLLISPVAHAADKQDKKPSLRRPPADADLRPFGITAEQIEKFC